MGNESGKETKHFLKRLIRKIVIFIKLIISKDKIFSDEDAGGDLRFDPSNMMKIKVTFDNEFLTKEKGVKLNVRGNRFFNEHKRDLRVINSVYVVYPSEYVIQFDVWRDVWEKRLMDELNNEYKLDLKRIHFINEEEICLMYQRKGIKEIRSPYNLQKGELLIIVGGFVNFNMDGTLLFDVKVNLKKESGIRDGKVVKKSYGSPYYDKYDQRAGAYFYVGGEWYHNIFIPEIYNKESSRFFSFRIAGDGKSIMFFTDLKMRGIDIRDEVKTVSTEESDEIIYTINPAYLDKTVIVDFKLSMIYEIKEEIEEENEEVVRPYEAIPSYEEIQEDEKIPAVTAEPPDKKDIPIAKIFISYSHDSSKHCKLVLALSDLLTEFGFDSILDQYETCPQGGWPRWMDIQINDADFVLIICTETYYRRVMEQEKKRRGLGIKWESTLTYHYLYYDEASSTRFIPILFKEDDVEYIPLPLKGLTFYCVGNDEGAEDLYHRLAKHTIIIKPELGKRRDTPTKDMEAHSFASRLAKIVS
jgi:hypothetical protein